MQPQDTLYPGSAELETSFDEGVGARLVRNRVSLPKALILLAAGLSFLLSVSLWFLADREQGLFVGLWVPSILSLGSLLLGNNGSSSE